MDGVASMMNFRHISETKVVRSILAKVGLNVGDRWLTGPS